MANKNVNQLSRPVASVSQITIPPMPRMPESMIKRFPELALYQAEWDRWKDQLYHQINKTLASAERSPPPTN